MCLEAEITQLRVDSFWGHGSRAFQSSLEIGPNGILSHLVARCSKKMTCSSVLHFAVRRDTASGSAKIVIALWGTCQLNQPVGSGTAFLKATGWVSVPRSTLPGHASLEGKAESGASAAKAVGGGHLLGNQTACQLSFSCLHPSADTLKSTQRNLW